MTWRRAALVYSALVLFVTLTPGSTAHDGWIHGCLVCGSEGWADALRNIVLFVPLGFTLERGWRARGGPLLTCLALTLAIEAAQTVVPGRDSSVGDILFNGVGGALGIGLATSVGLWLWPDRRAARGLAVGWATLVGLLVLALGWASGAARTGEQPVGQWTPRPRGMEAYTGLLLEAHAAQYAIPAWYLPDPEAATQAWMSGEPIHLRFLVGAPPTGRALLLRVVASTEELLSIGVVEDDLRVRIRSRFADLRLHDPPVRLSNVLETVDPGDTVRLSVWRDSERYCTVLEQSNEIGSPSEHETGMEAGMEAEPSEADCSVGVTLGTAWAAVVPKEAVPPAGELLMTLAWLALLAVPMGWWLGPAAGLTAGAGVAAWSVLVARASFLGVSGLQLLGLTLWGVLGGLARRRAHGTRGTGRSG